MKKTFLSIICATALFAACCSSQQNAETVTDSAAVEQTSATLLSGTYELMAINGEAINYTEEMEKPTLIFSNENNEVNGNAGCNTYFGSYSWDGGSKISFSNMGSTKMMGPKAAMELEDAFLAAMGNVETLSWENTSLILKGADGNSLIFTLVEE